MRLAARACAAALTATLGAGCTLPVGSSYWSFEIDDREREVLVHVPPGLPPGPAPLVLMLHGAGATAAGTERTTGFLPLAAREGFIAVYPQGIGRTWNDGRTKGRSVATRVGVDDVQFLGTLLETLLLDGAPDPEGRTHPIDPRRVFVAGISNGAFMANRIAAERADLVAAAGPMIGGMAEELDAGFAPSRPVSVCIIQGTDDPLVPYAGGTLGNWLIGDRGRILPTRTVAARWAHANGCRGGPTVDRYPDLAPRDGATIVRTAWHDGREGSAVLLLTVEGGGHTWPGGPQYLPRFLIGGTCRDVVAAEILWGFFRRHARTARGVAMSERAIASESNGAATRGAIGSR